MSPDNESLRRWIALAGAACLLASLAAVVLLDACVPLGLEHAVPWRDALVDAQRVIDPVTLKPISSLLGPVLLLGGWVAWKRGALKDRFVMAWGGVIALSVSIVDIVKPLLGRERPVHWLAANAQSSRWFVDHATSFPSGHTAYYWALVLPLSIRWPRVGVPLLALSIYVTGERVLVLAHHPGDVLASMGIALLATATLLPWIRAPACPPPASQPSPP